ncbi:MAG: hypothetical protein V7772_14145, partial [Pseudomonas profundi]
MKAPLLKLTSVAIGVLLSAGAMAYNPPGGGDGGDNGGGGGDFPSVSDFSRSGSFSTTNGNEGPSCSIYRPRTLGE